MVSLWRRCISCSFKMFFWCKMGQFKLQLVNKQNQIFKRKKKDLCDWPNPPVLRFIVPTHIFHGKTWKACCISVCIRLRPTSFLLANAWTNCHGTQYMDQSEEPTQPGVDVIGVTVGCRGQQTSCCSDFSFLFFQLIFTPSQKCSCCLFVISVK